MQFVHFILALAPIIWLIVALSVLKMPGYKACLITVAITAIEALIIWHFKPLYLVTAALEGALNALWPICLVIVAALFTYNLSLETGAMEKIKKMLAGVSTDQRVLALLIAWAFGHFMEGMAGRLSGGQLPADSIWLGRRSHDNGFQYHRVGRCQAVSGYSEDRTAHVLHFAFSPYFYRRKWIQGV